MTSTAATHTTSHGTSPCLSVHASAKYLGDICPRTMDNWRSQGRGPRYVRVGRRIMYRIVDLDAYLDARTVEVAG